MPKIEKEKLLDTTRAAAYLTSRGLRTKPQTLRTYRHRERGPVYIKPSGRVAYRIEDLDQFIADGRVEPKQRRLRSER
jgi:hypothetical protein